MSGYIKHYFVCANSAKGFRNLFDSNLHMLNKIYILKGGPGTGKSSLMKKIGTYFANEDFDIDYIHCSSDPDSLDGVVIRKLSVAIVDGTAPHIIEPKAPGAIEEYVNLGVAWNIPELQKHKKEILYLQQEISCAYSKAYKHFTDALKIHDEWEKIYIDHMDLKKADQLATKVAHEIIGTNKLDKEATIMHRFFGASTAEGSVNYVPNIIETVKKHYYIKGRPGSGKSTLLKKLMYLANERGIDAEIYHCSFDPDSLDMVLLPELDVCIFDSTAPHEYEPNLTKDHLVDMYAEAIEPQTDENNHEALSDIQKRYKQTMSAGTSELSYAKTLHDDLEQYYISASDFTKINAIYEDILAKIKSLI